MACTLNCGESKRIKACGGIGPYAWSKTGNVSLSATTGIAITVTSTAAGGGGTPGVFPGVMATLRPDLSVIWDDCAGCSGGLVHSLLSVAKAYVGFDCDGASLGSVNSSITSELDTSVRSNSCLGPVTGAPEGMDTIDCCTDPPASVVITVNYLLAAVSGSTTVTIPWHSGSVDADCASNASPITITADGTIDVRTAGMVSGGCGPCDQGTTTVTVTDGTGTQSTVILHA